MPNWQAGKVQGWTGLADAFDGWKTGDTTDLKVCATRRCYFYRGALRNITRLFRPSDFGFQDQVCDFYLEHRQRIDPWLLKIEVFPPSLQKLEWNCQGEDRNIWKYVLQFRASGVRVKRTNSSPSLVAMTTTQVSIIAWRQRYVTAREFARLQSMGELKHLPAGIAAMKVLGHAVNLTIGERILGNLLKLLPAHRKLNLLLSLSQSPPASAVACR